mmetsp:Transcript_29485/g.87710  ORF Transcript_29485/g.87710 Transcript_29485/m.87710 type:complete len:200 (-) Transcript_29485:416-1015(-)
MTTGSGARESHANTQRRALNDGGRASGTTCRHARRMAAPEDVPGPEAGGRDCPIDSLPLAPNRTRPRRAPLQRTGPRPLLEPRLRRSNLVLSAREPAQQPRDRAAGGANLHLELDAGDGDALAPKLHLHRPTRARLARRRASPRHQRRARRRLLSRELVDPPLDAAPRLVPAAGRLDLGTARALVLHAQGHRHVLQRRL